MRRLATLLLVLTFSPPLFAEDIRIPVGQQGLPEMTMPSRGDSKNQVLDRFGLADEERPAVWPAADHPLGLPGVFRVLRRRPGDQQRAPSSTHPITP